MNSLATLDMEDKSNIRGLLVLGTDTDVGKTYVACRIIERLVASQLEVGAYKPVASGVLEPQQSDGAKLWNATGGRGSLEWVMPQWFRAPLAPPVAAEFEQTNVDEKRLWQGLIDWQERCSFLVVEGAGGLMSPLSWNMTNADFALAAKLPIVLVVNNRLGVVNQVLTAMTAATALGLKVGWVVLNELQPRADHDRSIESNERLLASFLSKLTDAPIVTNLAHGSDLFVPEVEWER